MKRKSEASEKAISDRSNFNSDFVELFDAADPLFVQKLKIWSSLKINVGQSGMD